MSVQGGDGGKGGDSVVDGSNYALGGNGGGGGDAYCTMPSMEYQYIDVLGGTGGAGGNTVSTSDGDKRSAGGAGGNAYFEADFLKTSADGTAVNVIAGDAGTAANGGNAAFKARKVTGQVLHSPSSQIFSIASGRNSGNAKGGDVSFVVTESLSIETMNITKNDGAVTININELASVDYMLPVKINVDENAAWTANDVLAIKRLRFEGGDIRLNTGDVKLDAAAPNSIFVDSTKKAAPYKLFNFGLGYDIGGGNATFLISSTAWGNPPLLDVEGTPVSVNNGTTVDVSFQDFDAVIRNLGPNGNTLTLINNIEGSITPASENFLHGSLVYQMDTYTDQDKLNLGLFVADSELGNNHNLSYISRQTIVEKGANLTVDVIAQNEEQAREIAGNFGSSHTPFLTFNGGVIKKSPACSIRVSSATVNAGAASTFGFGESALSVAAFFDGGWGSYRSENLTYFSTLLDREVPYRGKGDVSYVGGGLMASYVLKNGWGFNAAVRAGKVGSDLDSTFGNFRRSSSAYVEGQVGLFRIFDVSSRSSVKPYARFMFFRQFGDTTTSDIGETVRYDPVNSSRLRAGVRYTYNFSRQTSAFVDASWEYQADGGVSSTVNGFATPGLRTNSHYGYLKLGGAWRQCPETGKGWSVAAAVTGYLEERKGVTGQLSVGYGF